MRRMVLAVASLVACSIIFPSLVHADETVTVVHAGRLLAVPGKPVQFRQSIVIRDGKIDSVHEGFIEIEQFGESSSLIDLSDQFVLPGMMDMHTHLSGELGPGSKLEGVTKSDVDKAMDSIVFARRTLDAGFTTVRDLGGTPEVIFGLRDAVERGIVGGPRIVAAGNAISGTGGHADVHGFRQEILDLFASPGICNGADDCRRAVRSLVHAGSDVIKITATGGVLSDVASGTGQQLFDDEMVSIVETAHLLGRKVAAHAHQADGINAALRAGVDSIDHGTLANDESMRLFKETGAYLVPTLLAGHTVGQMLESSDFLPPATRDKARDLIDAAVQTLGRAYAEGVKIAFGTDSGVSAHGTNADEFRLMIEAGMSPMDAIVAATVNAADLLGLSDEIGSIEVGKSADIVAVSGDPLEDITELERVTFVMRVGRVHKNTTDGP